MAVSLKIVFALLLLAVVSVQSFTVNSAFDKRASRIVRHRAVAAAHFTRFDALSANLLKSDDTDDTDNNTDTDTDPTTTTTSATASPTASTPTPTSTAVPTATATAEPVSATATETPVATPTAEASTASPTEVATPTPSSTAAVSTAASASPSATVSPSLQTGSFVKMEVTLAGLSAAEFTSTAQQAFKAAVASTAGQGVTASSVVITTFSDASSKASSLLVAFSVYADSSKLSAISSSVKNSDSLVANLNSEFLSAGVPVTVTGATVSTVSIENTDDSDNDSDNDKLSGGEIAGIVIGCVVGATLIVFAVIFFRRQKSGRPRWSKVMG